ncbi:MAG TPA: hypothetical protein PLV92_07770, partial [Pirellulaceae bacterium]|nr:hypothetical protein [Pirellulaceae bacterium]
MRFVAFLTRSMPFAGLQIALACLLAAGVAWSAVGAARSGAGQRMPRFASSPSSVRSLQAEPLVVSDEQLDAVVHKLRPRLKTPQPKVNYVDHALRFWGLTETAADDGCFSGEELRLLLTDDSRFVAAWGPRTRPLLRIRDGGVAVAGEAEVVDVLLQQSVDAHRVEAVERAARRIARVHDVAVGAEERRRFVVVAGGCRAGQREDRDRDPDAMSRP